MELESSYGATPDKTGYLRVSQVPPNPAILAPGPALFFVVVDGVPSIGVQVMIGSGQLGTQKILPVEPLPESSIPKVSQSQDATGNSNGAHSLRGSSNTLTAILSSALTISLLMVFFGL